MAAANGTPIRLVQENGKLIELDATTINFTVERGFQPHAIPASGGRRFGIDLNKNRSLIVVEGIFTDDRGPGTGSAATAVMDFSLSQEDFVQSFTSGGMDLTGQQGTFVTNDNIDNLLLDTVANKIVVKNASGTAFILRFETTSTIGYNTSTDKLCIKDSDDGTRITEAQFATGVAAWINTDVTDMTAVVIDSDKTGSSGQNCAVLITQGTSGEGGNQTAHPIFVKANPFSATGTIKSPYIEKFSGGETERAKSAGDKVMDMYGILSNSARRMSDPMPSQDGVGTKVASFIAETISRIAVNALTLGGSFVNSVFGDGDYIVGIQIPYNSKIQSGADTYVARNFFQPYGLLKRANDKGSEANTKPASTRFSTRDEYTGIQGAIKKMDIFYDAGETVYGYRMDFAPMDYMK